MSEKTRDRVERAFASLTPDERQLLTCALAGNYPERLAPLRMPVLRALAKADARRSTEREDETSEATS